MEPIRTEVIALGAVIVTESSGASASTATDNDKRAAVDGDEHAPSASSPCTMDLRVDPEAFRRVEEIVSEKTAGGFRSPARCNAYLSDRGPPSMQQPVEWK